MEENKQMTLKEAADSFCEGCMLESVCTTSSARSDMDRVRCMCRRVNRTYNEKKIMYNEEYLEDFNAYLSAYKDKDLNALKLAFRKIHKTYDETAYTSLDVVLILHMVVISAENDFKIDKEEN